MSDSVAVKRSTEDPLKELEPSASADRLVPGRDVAWDALRGLAVVIMVGANMAPYLLPHDYPFWFRAWTSLAAPLFIALSGFVAGHTASQRTRPWSHAIKRCLALLVIAVLVDWVCWGLEPFTSFDVLYLLALLQLVGRAISTSRPLLTASSGILVLLLTPLLQQLLGYRRSPAQPGLYLIQSWLLDGWFPVFPWLGVGLLGIYFGRLSCRFDDPSFRRRLLLTGFALLLFGTALWASFPPHLPTRGGYAELFYPPTPAFLVAMLGLLSLTAVSIPWFRGLNSNGVLAVLGRRALLVYILHLLIVGRGIPAQLAPGNALRFALCYAGLLALLWLVAWGTTKLWPRPRSFVARLLLG